MIDEKDTKEIIEALKPLQEKCIHLPCPRCGYDRMDEKPIRNALSRQADVYVCDRCGMDEALKAVKGLSIPLTQWSYIISLFD